jgi:two-component system NtrC family sensor kinase
MKAIFTDQELTELQKQLIQSEKLAAVGLLVAGIAHEINNPLTVIANTAKFLLEEDLSDEQRREVETIHRNARRAVKIMRGLLMFARQHKPERRYVRVNDVLRKTLALQEYDFRGSNLEIIQEFKKDLPGVIADEHQLQQVFLNVMINAKQAMMEAHGRGKLVVRTEPAGDMVRVSFIDDGPGIAPDALEKIFDPFFTTKAVGKGSGLGLSLSYGIIQEHGGRMSVHSQLGQGATFVVELPMASDLQDAEAVAVAQAQAAAPDDQSVCRLEDGRDLLQFAIRNPQSAIEDPWLKGSVLIVDDEADIVTMLKKCLEKSGLRVEVACESAGAIRKLNENGQYDLIICDLKLPGIGGQGIYRRLLERNPALARRFIFVTGDSANPETLAFLSAVDRPYLEKPFEAEQVLRLASQLLSQL